MNTSEKKLILEAKTQIKTMATAGFFCGLIAGIGLANCDKLVGILMFVGGFAAVMMTRKQSLEKMDELKKKIKGEKR